MITDILLTPHLGASGHSASENKDESECEFLQVPFHQRWLCLLNKSFLLGRKSLKARPAAGGTFNMTSEKKTGTTVEKCRDFGVLKPQSCIRLEPRGRYSGFDGLPLLQGWTATVSISILPSNWIISICLPLSGVSAVKLKFRNISSVKNIYESCCDKCKGDE